MIKAAKGACPHRRFTFIIEYIMLLPRKLSLSLSIGRNDWYIVECYNS